MSTPDRESSAIRKQRHLEQLAADLELLGDTVEQLMARWARLVADVDAFDQGQVALLARTERARQRLETVVREATTDA